MNANELLNLRQGRPIKILVVDDEENIRNIFRDFCNTVPLFEVTTVGGGAEALEQIKKQDFDMVTMDLIMPEISGLETIEYLKREKPHLPVIIVTGNATDFLIEEAGRMGGCRVMHKPVGIDQFLNELMELAEQKCCSD